MAFSSSLMSGEIVIRDDTPMEHVQPPPGRARGLRLGMRQTPFGAIPNAPPFPVASLIPRAEWQPRIEEMEATKTRLTDLTTAAGLKCKDQQQTNYCWINAPTYCHEVLRVSQNQAPIVFSPASCGARIKGFRNVGGFGEEAISYIAENGQVPVDKWPANAIDRQYDTPDNQALARKYRVTEWWELEPGNLDQLISCLLLRWPVAVGLGWWSHEVSFIDPVWVGGAVGVRFRNSWGMSWGSEGYSVLQGRKMLPDDAQVPRLATAA